MGTTYKKTIPSYFFIPLFIEYMYVLFSAFSVRKPLRQPHRGNLQHEFYTGSHNSHVSLHIWKMCQAINLLRKKNPKHSELIN